MNPEQTITDILGFYDVKGFQQAWNLGPALVVDGILGPKTNAALQRTTKTGNRLSAHFTAKELQCPHCDRLKVTRQLLFAAEVYRAKWGPLIVRSGYRCPTHNRAVGGASHSQHLDGRALDVRPEHTLGEVEALKVFHAIGYSSSSRVVHVDMRPGGYTGPRPLTFRDGA